MVMFRCQRPGSELEEKSFRKNIILTVALGLACGTLLSSMLEKWDGSNIFSVMSSSLSRKKGSACADDQIASKDNNRIGVLCMIITMPSNRRKTMSVRDTWAKRCTTYYFVSSEVDPSLPSIAAVKNESRAMLWPKTVYAIKHAMEHYSNDHDYFLKADDDTYMIMENLRKLLSEHDPNEPMLMGRRFSPNAKLDYTSGGAGYVLSRAGLQHVYEGLMNDGPCSKYPNKSEDVNLGRCAEAMKVPLIDSLDQTELERFHPFTPRAMMSKSVLKPSFWISWYNYHPIKAFNISRVSGPSKDEVHVISKEDGQLGSLRMAHAEAEQ